MCFQWFGKLPNALSSACPGKTYVPTWLLRRRSRYSTTDNPMGRGECRDSPQLLSECRPIRPDLIDYKVDGGSDAGDALEVRVRNHPVSSVKSHGWQHNS